MTDYHSLAIRLASRSVEARKKPRRTRKTSKPKKNLLEPKTEFSAQVDISLVADFEGDVSEQALKKKLKNEIMAALKAGVISTARGFNLQATGILIKPLNLEISVNDTSSIDDMEEF